MINNSDTNQQQGTTPEGNIPLNEANEESSGGFSAGRLKDYGKKSLSPLVGLFHKYQDEINPFFDAISRGLQGGYDALSSGGSKEEGQEASTSDVDKIVASWFKDASQSLSEASSKLSGSSPKEIIDYLESQANRHPGFMFSTSYLAGLFFGRIGRHVGRKKTNFEQSSTEWSAGSESLTQ